MDEENSIIASFLTHISENDNNESKQFSKKRLQQAYSTFIKSEGVKESISFATLQLRLKDEGAVISEGRDNLRFVDAFPGQKTLGSPLNAVSNLFSKTNIPEFASNTKFFLVEAESFEDVKESTESGRLIVPEAHQDALNEAFNSSDQVVFLVCVRYGNRLRGFCTMDSLVSRLGELKHQWSSANLKADDMFCEVSWEKLGDHPIPVDTRIGTEMDAQKGRNQCQAFYFERQSSIGEFKSPESALETTAYAEDLSKVKGASLQLPLIDAFSRCEEDRGESEEDFRRRSMDKIAAAAHYEMPPRKTGVVVKFSQQKGYGFIRPDYDYVRACQLPDIFVHRTSIVSSNKVPNLRVGQKTEYDVTLDPRTGKPHAVNVTGPNRVPLDEMKLPVPPLLERPPLYGHSVRNVKAGKPWNASVRKMNLPMGAPLKTPSQNSGYPKTQSPEPWSNAMSYSDKSRSKWESDKAENRFLPKEMNMTVTIDNDLPSNVSRYQHRQTPSPRSQVHWGQPQFSHDYYGHYDMHRGHSFKTQGGARQMSSTDYGGRDWKVTSPAREVPNDYENYGRRDQYWRYEQDIPQYDGDYRQVGYDYRYPQRDYRQQNW